ncbi:hypothetical protein D3C80_722050 [compost metagenome]
MVIQLIPNGVCQSFLIYVHKKDKYSEFEGSQATLNTERKERPLQRSIRDKPSLNKMTLGYSSKTSFNAHNLSKSFSNILSPTKYKVIKINYL